jgi:hypothetical protein
MAKKKSKGSSKSLTNSITQKLPNSISSMGSMNTNMATKNNINKIHSYAWTGIIFLLIALTISLAINISAILWIRKLEEIKCACSEHWMRTYIKYYLYVLIPLSVFNSLLTIYMLSTSTINNYSSLYYIYRIFTFIFGFFGFANIFISIIFISKLKEINCVCSEDIKREVYWIYNIVLLAIISINILFTLIMLPFLIYGGMYNK